MILVYFIFKKYNLSIGDIFRIIWTLIFSNIGIALLLIHTPIIYLFNYCFMLY